MDTAALNARFTSPPVVTVDDLYHVLRHTLLSPFFTGGLLAFTHLFQKRAPLDDKSKIYLSAYFGITWALWFSSWTSRVWAGKHWRHGLDGLLGLHRLSWDNEIVVVTGGCRGVGKAIVNILDTKKVTVVVLERSIPEESRKEIYNDVHFYECDVSDYKTVIEVFERVTKEVGSPTVLINNAGIVTGRSILELSEADIRNTFDVNAIAHFWTIKAVLPKMLERGAGHIVNVSSFLGTIGVASLSDYCASKHALLGLHDSLSAEIRTHPAKPNIHVTTVCPGHIRTPLFAGLGRFSAFNAFMFPLQEPHMVARGIVDRIEREQGGELHLPVLGNLSWLWRGLPSWARDGVKGLSQADNLMGDFHRRAKE